MEEHHYSDREDEEDYQKQQVLHAPNRPQIMMTAPFRLMVVARSQMGKTTLMVKLMLYYWVKTFNTIFVFCPTYTKDKTWRPLDDYYGTKLKVYCKVTDNQIRKIWSHCDKLRVNNKDLKFLVYFDDCTGQEDFKVQHESGIINQLVSKGNHSGISSVYVVQKFTQCSTTMRVNAEGLITFYTQSETEKKYIWSEFGFGNFVTFKRIVDLSTSKPYHSFFVNRQGPGMPDYFHNFRWIDVGAL